MSAIEKTKIQKGPKSANKNINKYTAEVANSQLSPSYKEGKTP